jgi:hypothetical protein
VSLLAITAAHPTSTWLKVRYREQAHSYSFCSEPAFTADRESLWELACQRWRRHIQYLTANPCGSWLASDGGGTSNI